MSISLPHQGGLLQGRFKFAWAHREAESCSRVKMDMDWFQHPTVLTYNSIKVPKDTLYPSLPPRYCSPYFRPRLDAHVRPLMARKIGAEISNAFARACSPSIPLALTWNVMCYMTLLLESWNRRRNCRIGQQQQNLLLNLEYHRIVHYLIDILFLGKRGNV